MQENATMQENTLKLNILHENDFFSKDLAYRKNPVLDAEISEFKDKIAAYFKKYEIHKNKLENTITANANPRA